MKFKSKKIIAIGCSEWDKLVQETYNKPYNFQQQEGCRNRGTFEFTVPIDEPEDFENDSINPENEESYGVSFEAWLARDPKKLFEGQKDDWEVELTWDRNFYPCVDMIIDDLYHRGILEAGEYLINIDW